MQEMWNAQKILEILNKNYELRKEVLEVLCPNDISAFISDPKKDLHKSIRETVTHLQNIGARIYPETTSEIFDNALENLPTKIVYLGHAEKENEHNFVVVGDSEPELYSFEKFLMAIKTKYVNKKAIAPRYILLLSCFTDGVVDILERYKKSADDDEKSISDFFKNTTFVGWKTNVESKIASKFDRLLISSASDNSLNIEEFKHLCGVFINDIKINTGKDFGDPLIQLLSYEIHCKIFCESFNEIVRKSPMRSSWYNIGQRIGHQFSNINKYIPSCSHCNPLVVGIPFIYKDGVMYVPDPVIVEEEKVATTPVPQREENSGPQREEIPGSSSRKRKLGDDFLKAVTT